MPEADQARLTREIRNKQAELAYWSSFEVDDAQLERISNRLMTALDGEDLLRARLSLSTFIREIALILDVFVFALSVYELGNISQS